MASFLRIGHPFRALVTAGKIVATFHVFSEYGYTFAPAGGPSMLPTFERDGEWLLTSKRHRHARRVAVGDLVVYKIPYSPDTEGIKRVLGLPGDYVLLNSPKSGSDTMIQVPPGHCWLVGDNLSASRDSRDFGPVPLALVRGKVIANIRSDPGWEFRWIKNPLVSYSPVSES